MGSPKPNSSHNYFHKWGASTWCSILAVKRCEVLSNTLSRLTRTHITCITKYQGYLSLQSVVLAGVISPFHSPLCIYSVQSSSLEVLDTSTNGITTIITTIMYWFRGSIVSVSFFSNVIVGTSDGLIAASENSWAIIRHPLHFFSLAGWTMLATVLGIIRLI